MEKHGITTLKMVVMWGISLAQQIEQTFEDGKFRWHEAFGFIDEGKALAELIPFMDEAVAELKDLSHPEKLELMAYVKQELQLDNIWAARITNNALDLATATYLSIKTFKDLKAEKQKPQA